MSKLSPHEIAWLALEVARWPRDEAVIMTAVALAESNGDTDIIARSTTGANVGQRDHGLWQISGRWHGKKMQAMSRWRDPRVNAVLAKQVYDETKAMGKEPKSAWAVYNSGTYKVWLPDAEFGIAAPFPPPVAVIETRIDTSALEADIQALRGRLEEVLGEVLEIREHFA